MLEDHSRYKLINGLLAASCNMGTVLLRTPLLHELEVKEFAPVGIAFLLCKATPIMHTNLASQL